MFDVLHILLALGAFVAVGWAFRERGKREQAEKMPARGGGGRRSGEEGGEKENGGDEREG